MDWSGTFRHDCHMSKLDDTRAAVATRIRQAREAQGVTQPELARRATAAGWSAGASAIAKIESGRRSVEVVEAAILADALDIRFSDLVGDLDADVDDDQRAERLRRQVGALLAELRESASRSSRLVGEIDDALVSLSDVDDLDVDALDDHLAAARECAETIRTRAVDVSVDLGVGGVDPAQKLFASPGRVPLSERVNGE